MKIKTFYETNGARTDFIELSSEENKAIDDAIIIIKNRCIETGYPKDYKNWNDEQFRLLGILRVNGVDEVLNFAKTAEITPYKTPQILRGYS